MLRVTISELKDQLSAYLKRVRAGETVIVMDRSTPIARLQPLSRAERSGAEALAHLEATGVIRPARRKMTPELLQPIELGRPSGVLEALLEERREGR